MSIKRTLTSTIAVLTAGIALGGSAVAAHADELPQYNDSSYSNVSTNFSGETQGDNGTSARIANIASQYMGVPYGFGDSPAQWNCTGFTKFVLESAGINIGWGWPADQAAAAVSLGAVQTDNPVPGDLVIQENGGTGEAHAAIYAGNGMTYAAENEDIGTVMAPVSWGSGTTYYHFS